MATTAPVSASPAVLASPATSVSPAPAPATTGSPATRAAHRMPFLLLVCGLLGGALVCALVISTTLAQGSFQISQLQQQGNALVRQRQGLEAQVAQARSAQVIERSAYKLGMRPVGTLRFLDLPDGQVKTDVGKSGGFTP